MKFCFNCGAQIIENSKECPCCGIDLIQVAKKQKGIRGQISNAINVALNAGLENRVHRAKAAKPALPAEPKEFEEEYEEDDEVQDEIKEKQDSVKLNLDFEKQIETIRKVKELQDDGIISEEEFKDKVRKIFDL